jgi:hypothetical protein
VLSEHLNQGIRFCIKRYSLRKQLKRGTLGMSKKLSISKIFYLSLISVFIVGCNNPNHLSNDEIHIYQRVIEKLQKEHNSLENEKYYYVLDSSLVYYLPHPGKEKHSLEDEILSIKTHFPNVSEYQYDDFISKNLSFIKIELPTSSIYKIFKSDEYNTVRNKSKTIGFFRKMKEDYSDFYTLLRFSIISFNKNHDQALLYMDYEEAGQYIMLRKIESIWSIVKWQQVWQS